MIRRRRFLLQSLVLLLVTLGILGDVVVSGDRVLSSPDGDGANLFLGVRAWGFDQIRQGHLLLWNPHLFCGTPFLGGFQSALLYPPNLIYAILPIERAMNIDIGLHLWLSGLFMLAWLAHLRMRSLPALLGAIVFMLGAPHFLHVYPGHLPQLCTIAWMPLIFLAIDGAIIARRGRLGWVLVGSFALAMQVLAGFPQFVLYGGLIAALYVAARLLKISKLRRSVRFAILSLASMLVLAGGLSSIQWMTSAEILPETTRRHLPIDVVTNYSLPIENLLTLITPRFFGDITSIGYWGRWYFWETTLFIGIAPLVLAIYGAIWSRNPRRGIIVVLAALSLLLATGSQTPLFHILYTIVPGFAQFRGPSRFTAPALFLLATLAAFGLQTFRVSPRAASRRVAILIACSGVSLLIAVLAVRWADSQRMMRAILGSASWDFERFLPREIVFTPAFVAMSTRQFLDALTSSAVVLLAVGVCFAFGRRIAPAVLVFLSIVELTIFARLHRPTFHPPTIPNATSALRIDNPNQSAVMLSEGFSIWGNDATVLQRYRDLAGALGGLGETSEPTQSPFVRDPSRLGLLRVTPNALPRALVVHRWRVVPDRAAALKIVADDSFNPREEVVLESAPAFASSPAPVTGAQRPNISVLDRTSDEIDLNITTADAGILLITDNYAGGWKVHGISAAAMPANVSLIGIPLGAGHYQFELHYEPTGFAIGRIVTIASCIVATGLLIPYAIQLLSRPTRGAMLFRRGVS
jgi:hypothetical protein